MKMKSLSALIALGLMSGIANAQDYDDRWYVAPTFGLYHNDSDREAAHSFETNGVFAGIGFGKYLAPNSSLDIFLDHTQRDLNNFDGLWRNTTAGVALRHYFTDGNWQPFIKGGIGLSRHKTDFAGSGWDPTVLLGAGLQRRIGDDNTFRTELNYRHDFDTETLPSEGSFGDWTLGVGFTHAFGKAKAAPEPEAPKAAEPAAETAAVETDHDHDGVLTAEDQCPDSPAGSVVGPDGCPQAITIDLRGVEFKFDRPTGGETAIEPTLNPNSDSMAILNNAVTTLKQYPNLKVEVAGHTDSIGTDAYNQDLSQRRVNIVAEYLKSQGVNADQLMGMNGYGESRPIDSNATKEGRQRNRRTELNAQK